MECLAGAWNIVPSLWQCSAKHAKYIVVLEDNLASLRSEGLNMMNISADVRTKVREAEEQQKRARNQVNGWLASVEAMEKELNLILHKGDQELGNKCLGRCCPKNCGSSYKIGKKVLKMIPQVTCLWLAEGLIGEYDSMYDALIQGRQIMDSLKQACLLETGKRSLKYSRTEETVKMHDMIRDMALWIASKRGEKRNKFCIEVACGDIPVAPNAATNSEKISLWGTGIVTESLAGMSFCPDLSTLIIQNTSVEELPDEIVHSMNALKVLNLSGNEFLMRFPIGCWENLEYLNIAWTPVRLPREVSQWKKLRFLIVDNMALVPKEIISSLCSLEMFEQLNVLKGRIRVDNERKSMEDEMLSELEGLKHIMDIRLALNSASGIKILLGSSKLKRCTTRLAVKQVESLPDMLDFGMDTLTKHLERLEVEYCHMSEVKLGRLSLCNDLCEVSFSHCYGIRNLSSLIYAPNLSILNVDWCKSMSELIGEETRSSNVGTSLFSSLKSLTLKHLPELRSICPQSALSFPSLEFTRVLACWSMRKLPLDSNTARTTPPQLKIQGQRQWWDGLEWDSQATKHAFTPRFTVY